MVTLDRCLIIFVRGMPVRPPIYGLIAEAALQWLEAIIFPKVTLKLWKRHADDTFDKPANFHMALNSALRGIQFTLDKDNIQKSTLSPPDRYIRNLIEIALQPTFSLTYPLQHLLSMEC